MKPLLKRFIEQKINRYNKKLFNLNELQVNQLLKKHKTTRNITIIAVADNYLVANVDLSISELNCATGVSFACEC